MVEGQRAVDELSHRTQVARRVERSVDLLCRKLFAKGRLRQKLIAERPASICGPPGGRPYDLVGLQAPEAIGDNHRNVFGHEHPPCLLKVLPHLFGMDLQPLRRLSHGGRGPARQGECVGERLPLGVPGAGGALVLARHAP